MKIIGHRGCNELGGENTCRAINIAIDTRVNGIEMDLRAVDDHIIALHDETVDRTTNGTGHYKSFSVTKIRRLYCKNGDRIPLLDEILRISQPFEMLILEIKEPGIEDSVIRALRKASVLSIQIPGKIVLSSFDLVTSKNLAKKCRNWQFGLLYKDSFLEAIERAKHLNASYIHAPLNHICSRNVDTAHSSGLEIYAYTINDPEEYLHCLNCGVDGIFTDKPKRFVTSEIRYER